MPQIKAYHRPTTVGEALQLLNRPGVNTALLAGGTYQLAHMNEMVEELVDLQAVRLTDIDYTGQGARLGSMVRLQTLVADERSPNLLQEAARQEGPNTMRNAATLGGVIASPNKESELLAALLVFEAEIHVQSLNQTKTIPLADFLLDVPTGLGSGLITAVTIKTMGQTASARVGRTPADKPIVAALARKDQNGQTLLALCGVANTPVLVHPDNVKAAVSPSGDFRGSREYRRQMAAILSQRVLNRLA